MITVMVSINSLGDIEGYGVSGHADYGPHGQDIVCAAVSILAQTTLLALNKVCNIDENKIDYTIDDKSGYLQVSLPSYLEEVEMEDSQIVLRTFEVGIKSIIEAYPKYVFLKYREV